MAIKKRLLGLDQDGKLIRQLDNGAVQSLVPAGGPSVVYLLLDCSGSMAGEKLSQARRGAEDFAQGALIQGFAVGVITFSEGARVIAAPGLNGVLLRESLGRLAAVGGTDLTAGLNLAMSELRDRSAQSAIVVVTDGRPDNRESALAAARSAMQLGIRVITIGTDDADKDFLARLSTAPNLASFVDAGRLEAGIAAAATLLAGKRVR